MTPKAFLLHSLPRLALSILAFAANVDALAAEPWRPSKPIRLVVSFPPGGVADVMSRIVAEPLGIALGQPVIVDNRGGAGGNLGGATVAKSPPDGQTLLATVTTVESMNPLMFSQMGFDPARDLTPVAMLGGVKLFLLTKKDLPVSSASQFVEYAKTSAAELSYGSASVGSMTHLAAELFKEQAAFRATHIPYRGAAPALQDLLGGQIDFVLDPGIGFAHVRAGKVKMLAVASLSRSSLFPNVPTLHELGYRGVNGDTLFSVYAPAGTSNEVVVRLNQEINKTLGLPEVKAKFAELGAEPMPMSPKEVKTKVLSEALLYGDLVKARGIRAD